MRALALLLYLVLAATTVRSVGLVGETSVTYTLTQPPPTVLDPAGPLAADGWRAGPLVAAQVRPTERLDLGMQLPLAVNSYTGAPPDWPAAVVWALTRSHAAVVGLHVGLGGLLLLLVHRFLRFHGSPHSGAVAMVALASDWSFVFYRKVLGGTEVLLMAAGLLVLWSLWSRRWAGGRHGAWAIAVGVGLGLMAKATFAVTLAALLLAALCTRWDRSPLKAPPAPPWTALVGIVLALTAPVWVGLAHHAVGVPEQPHVVSHDFVGLQWERLFDAPAAARESARTLRWFLLDPLAWFQAAYDAPAPRGLVALRGVGFGVIVAGTAICWWQRRPDRSDALLRFVSLFVPMQLLGLWLANRDLHHLGQASWSLAIWLGLAAIQVVRLRANPRSWTGAGLGLLLAAPWAVDGSVNLARTDAVLARVSSPTLLAEPQQRLVELVRAEGVSTLHACDYDLYGMLDPLLPEVEVVHSWPWVSRRAEPRARLLDGWVEGARGGHLLVVRASAPMIYNLTATPAEMEERGAREVARLEDEDGWWAVLYEAP